MKTWLIAFSGKTKGAIGAFQNCAEEVEADSSEAAVLKLYDKYEHVLVNSVIDQTKE
jgi:hypothetical protein